MAVEKDTSYCAIMAQKIGQFIKAQKAYDVSRADPGTDGGQPSQQLATLVPDENTFGEQPTPAEEEQGFDIRPNNEKIERLVEMAKANPMVAGMAQPVLDKYVDELRKQLVGNAWQVYLPDTEDPIAKSTGMVRFNVFSSNLLMEALRAAGPTGL